MVVRSATDEIWRVEQKISIIKLYFIYWKEKQITLKNKILLRYSLSVCESPNNVLRNVKNGQENTSLQ